MLTALRAFIIPAVILTHFQPCRNKNCPVCGTALKQIGEEFVRRELVFIPARLKVREYYSCLLYTSRVQSIN